MAELKYVVGDATQPQGSGTKIICHCCNDEGGWGSGFVVALSKRWKEPERQYRYWAQRRYTNQVHGVLWSAAPVRDKVPFELGQVIFVQVEDDTWVANIIGQHQTIRTLPQPVRYAAIRAGLRTVRTFCTNKTDSVHMPRMGAGLAGGDWSVIEKIVQEALVYKDVDVTVYDLPGV